MGVRQRRERVFAVARIKSLLNERTRDIAQWFGVSTRVASQVKDVVRRYQASPSIKKSMALDEINDLIGGEGTEAVYPSIGFGSVAPVLAYVNLGDPYFDTVCYDYKKDKFFVGCWGDWVVDYETKGGRVY